jgi:hypothetical protein
LFNLVVHVIHQKQLVHINPVLVAHQVPHVFDQNVIVIMKPTKSNKNKNFFLSKFFFCIYSVHHEEINIIHIKHQLILMKMLMIHFMMKINGNKYKKKYLKILFHIIELQINHQHQILVRINLI